MPGCGLDNCMSAGQIELDDSKVTIGRRVDLTAKNLRERLGCSKRGAVDRLLGARLVMQPCIDSASHPPAAPADLDRGRDAEAFLAAMECIADRLRGRAPGQRPRQSKARGWA